MRECKISARDNIVSTSAEIQLTTPKSETSYRYFDLPEIIVNTLKRHKTSQKENKIKLGGTYTDNDLFCCYPGGRMIDSKNFSKKFAHFLKKNGLKHIRFHYLRHSNVTLILSYGVPTKITFERLGHSPINITTGLYSHVKTNI